MKDRLPRAFSCLRGVILAAVCLPCLADEPAQPAGARSNYRTTNFSLWTDLPETEAQQLVDRLETTLNKAEDYWKRPQRGSIQCFVARNLEAWHDRELPNPMARLLISRVGGVAVSYPDNDAGGNRSRIVVFAAARPGVPEHETIHAYCGQTFGTTGPTWYREGMAQVLASDQSAVGEDGLQFPEDIAESLVNGPTMSLNAVVLSGDNIKKLCDSLEAKAVAHVGLVGLVPDSQWNDDDTRSLGDIKATYAWSWLTCQFLEHNPNYQSRFRAMGQEYLVKQDTNAFSKWFDPVAPQLKFEYDFMVNHLSPGYRVDLCAWDWNKRWKSLDRCRNVRTKVLAARGFQPTGLLVTTGEVCSIQAVGTWTIQKQGTALTARGGPDGNGQLEAVLLKDFQLSEPFLLNSDSQFTAPQDGQLYLRCRDAWSALGDNEGSLAVSISRVN